MSERRVACLHCKTPILVGAQKCRGCKKWLSAPAGTDPSKLPRTAAIVASAVLSTALVLVTSRESPVGEAPPLTPLPDEVAAGASEPAPGAFGPEPELLSPARPDEVKEWKSREILLGDVRPLDVIFSASGETIFVSGDDATLREYTLVEGELIHKASMPAQGTRLKLLFDRYVAVIRPHHKVGRIPVMDTTRWDRDPVLLPTGPAPTDVIEHPDGKSVVTATRGGKRMIRYELPTGLKVADITLPQTTTQLIPVRVDDRAYLAALGSVSYDGRPAGAWLDLFDPEEAPFGATRRSIPVGRTAKPGSVTQSGDGFLFPDHAANQAVFVELGEQTRTRTVSVGQAPESAYVLGDRYGITLNSEAQTASVIELDTMRLVNSLMLRGSPGAGVISPDGGTLFVTLGGADWPPTGEGVVVIAGDPPAVVTQFDTGRGAVSVSTAPGGARVAVANYASKSVTILE